MERAQVLSILRAHKAELQSCGIEHLRLFGSVARGTQKEVSDVDLLADFYEGASMSLFGLCHLENRIADLLETKVDLISSKGLRNFAREYALPEAIVAF